MTPIRYTALAAAAAIAVASLGACKKEAVVAKDESLESVAKKVAASDLKPRPGRWETTITMGKVEMAGMPAGAAEAMSKAGPHDPIATCLTPEDVAKMGDGSMFQNMPKDCKYDSFKMAAGKVEGEMSCAMGAQKMHSTMSGDYGPDAYNVKMATQSDMGGGRTSKMEMSVASRRTGECNGTEMKRAK